MSRTRLPRPGEVLEHCRLCGAVLEVSVENPRRTCAACGEVNLPNDQAPLLRAPAPRPSNAFWLREARMLPLGAASPLAAWAACVPLGASAFPWVLGPLTLASFAGCLWRGTRPGARAVAAALFWACGLVTGLGLSLALSYAASVLTWLWR